MIRLFCDMTVFRLQKAGGISTYWYELMSRALDDSSVSITFLMTKNEGEIDNIYYKDLCNQVTEAIPEKFSSSFAERVSRARLPILGTRSIYHSSYFRTTHTQGVRNVVTVHDFTHQMFYHGLARIRNTMMKRRALNDADGIICVSESTKRDLYKLFPDIIKKEVRVIPNACSDDYRLLESAGLPSGCEMLANREYILFVGSRAFYKNFQFAIEILRETEWLTLVVVGGGEFSKDERAKLSNCTDRVLHIQGLSNSDLNLLYNNAFALLYPSMYEGFGIPPLEAMNAGCPVIAFNNSSIPEVLGDGGFLISNNDRTECQRALKSLQSPSVRDTKVAAGLERAAHFSWDKSYRLHRNLYRELA